MKKQLVTAGFVLFSVILPLKASAVQFTGIYAFGDSLTDTGNVYNSVSAFIPGAEFPPPPYFPGRFSNGPVWIDELAEKLNLESPTPFFKVTQGFPPIDGINFAFGGATTTPDNTISLTIPELAGLPGLPQQVGAFQSLLNNQPQADPNALYILWAGANDYLPTLGSFQPRLTPNETLGNLADTLQALAGLGVKKVLVPNLPDLGITPAARTAGESQRLSELTLAHNAGLAELIKQFDQNPLLDLDVIPLDVYSLFSNPAALGFTDAENPCLDLNATPPTLCNNPEDYLFWDNQHPTTTAHKILGDYAYQQLRQSATPVPEPSVSLGLLTLGAVVAFARLKRQQKKLAFTPTSQVLDVQPSRIKVES
ncbi:GDSL family lipase [Anabaenopsis circularis NIES-21]|uniref:GDSL family lipase n=2 Tax=Nostocales TaxID=1161 RepID=A0A1Z4GGS6_9CYAN|nr:SGNH/GDSL hydrolase family protein [Nostoc cycadae]BAY16689.1 GDSL family lipase [Anabaenopsis circularis NIES-21]GBE94755.1 phospholipase/lecithinase/hemolysin [Nostoc cycadae WK-1]